MNFYQLQSSKLDSKAEFCVSQPFSVGGSRRAVGFSQRRNANSLCGGWNLRQKKQQSEATSVECRPKKKYI